MKKIYLMLFSLSLMAVTIQAQVQQPWVARANGVENKEEYGHFIALDVSGNVYVSAARYGTADDDDAGFLTIKYNPVNGHVVWAHINNGAGNGNAAPHAMAVDAAGNVYVTGSTGATSDGQKYHTIKYNTAGALLWEHSYTSSRSGEYGDAIAVDASGNVFVAGFSTSDDYWAIGIIKYNAAGDRIWVKHYKGDSKTDDRIKARGIVVDASGNIYITGYKSYEGTGKDIIILKYNNNGELLSSNRYDGPSEDEPTALKLDVSGNIYITGKSYNPATTSYDAIVLKYNSNCQIVWERLYNGAGNEDDRGVDVEVDASGNVYIGVVGIVNLANHADYITVKYDASGTKLWDVFYNGPNNPGDLLEGVALDAAGNVYVTGYSGEGSLYTSQWNYVTIKYNSSGVQQWLQTYDGPPGYRDEASDIVVDGNDNVYVTGTSFGGDATRNDGATVKYTQCGLVCPPNITVNNDAGKCDAIVTFADVTTTGDCGATLTYSHSSGSTFPVGETTVTVTSDESGASCSFTITVHDNEVPVLTCPPNLTVNTNAGTCYATVNPGEATVTDNCIAPVTGVRSDGLALNANYPAGVTSITWTARDASNASACIQTITVVDNQPPVISGESASIYVLSPPNHTMRDVTINYGVTDNCSWTAGISVTSNEPVNGTGDGNTDPDWIVTDNHHVKLRAERSANGNGRIYTITITATDPSGNTAVKTVQVRVPHNIKNPHSGKAFIVGSTVSFEGEFWDKPGNSHSAKWLIDNTTVGGTITAEPNGIQNGKAAGSYKFTAAGVYKLQMNIKDQNGVVSYANTQGDLEAIVVIYDPNGGNTYGGGYYNSPAGALKSNPSATGKASYGFAMSYFKNSTNPKGETQFEFKVGTFEFNALTFEYLAISNSKAQFKGTGKIIGGQSGVGFIMTVTDGALNGTGIDKIRMKIYNKNTGAIIYDNQPGASDAALPAQSVGTNSIVVISGANSSLTSANTNQKGEVEAKVAEVSNDLDVIAFPNPSAKQFSVQVKTSDLKTRIQLQVLDQSGRVVKKQENVIAGVIVQLGELYRPGVYYVRIMQGKEHKELKLVKLSD